MPSFSEPHRGVIVLVLGLMSLLVLIFGCSMCFPLGLASFGLSIPAIIMAKNDFRKMDAGTMDPSGRDTTKAGYIISAISIALSIVGVLLMLALMVLYGGLIGFASMGGM